MKARNVWAEIDALKQKYADELHAVKVGARLNGFVRAKCASTGMWSAARAAHLRGGADALHLRTAAELVAAMEREHEHHKRRPKPKPERARRAA
jgi:hypothetical protein